MPLYIQLMTYKYSLCTNAHIEFHIFSIEVLELVGKVGMVGINGE